MILLGKRSEDIGIVVHGRHARETESSDWETIIVDGLGVTREANRFWGQEMHVARNIFTGNVRLRSEEYPRELDLNL